jgi:fructokinase
MKTNTSILVFGEAIFDCFPDGEQVLGGAPFNVIFSPR